MIKYKKLNTEMWTEKHNLYKMFMLKYEMISTGVAVGAGWQSIVAYVNVGCYYVIGIPVGMVLGHVLRLEVKVRIVVVSFTSIRDKTKL